MSDIECRGLVKAYGSTRVVHGFDLKVEAHEFVVFLGPSGCGKSTILRMIAGLEEISGGDLVIGGRRVNDVAPQDRNIAMVFQNYALYPHMSVRDNITFGLRRSGLAPSELDRRVREVTRMLNLEDYLQRKPAQLSGGQQQRVALARALINHPQVLLLDEPLGALDLKLRRQMQVELKRIQTEVGITFVHVTHDQEEAMTMADTVAVMNAGKIEQLGSPVEMYDFPGTAFVANFLGQSNLFAATVTGRSGDDVLVESHGARFSLPAARSRVTDGPVWLGVRPEKLHLATGLDKVPTGHQCVTGIITDSSYVGVSTQYLVRPAWGDELTVFAPNSGVAAPLAVAGEVTVHWRPEHAFLLPRPEGQTVAPVVDAEALA